MGARHAPLHAQVVAGTTGALLVRVPFVGTTLAAWLAGDLVAGGPSLPVRTMRQGLHLAYGCAGAITGVTQALLGMI